MANNPEQAVFLNLPYDPKFRDLYLAYIVGVSALGLVPRATLEIPGDRRLDRIFGLIQKCRYSIHDLSRVQVDARPPHRTPRFNMPFELGLAVAWSRSRIPAHLHEWFVFESVPRRADKSLSDIMGTDIYVHDGHVVGVLRQLRNALVRHNRRPTVPQMQALYGDLKSNALKTILRDAGTKDLFQAQVFADIASATLLLAGKHIPLLP